MNKENLIKAVIEAARENSTATVFFHMAMAEATGMCPSDHKALDLILRQGSMTAGEIGSETGLASASVTSLIDRLETRGYVRRVRDDQDRRKVAVEAVPERIEEIGRNFAPLKQGVHRMLARYDEQQLEGIRDFLQSATGLLHEEVVRLSNGKAVKGCVN